MDLSIRDITYCKGVGTRRADIFRKELKVQTALDLLRYYPYKYIDRSRFISIADIEDDETYIQIKGEITEFHTIGIGRGQRLSATFSDGRHTMELVWFRQIQYVKLLLHTPYLLFGKPSRFNHAWNMVHPELTPLEKVRPETTQGLEASYSMTEKMRQSGLN